MNQQDQIKQLEESNQELQKQERLLRAQIELQAKQIEALKTAPAQSDEERFGPYKGVGWIVGQESVADVSSNIDRKRYHVYATVAQAEWEFKATQVRRKLQNICAVLGPAEASFSGYCIPGVVEIAFDNYYDMRHAEMILGADLKYLYWNNSPEAMDARKEK